MKELDRIIISTDKLTVRSLCWRGDALVDWVTGGVKYELDGSCFNPLVRYAYEFDHAVASSDGLYAALVTRLGTTGLLLKDGEIIRQINRSFYQANAYEYPIAFLNLPDGQTGIAHCPDRTGKLDIEEVESGRRLTERKSEAGGFFHSRLAASPDNRFLLSAGWSWAPFNEVWVYDLARSIERPESLDQCPLFEFQFSRQGVETESGAFAESGLLVVASSDDDFYYEPDDIEPTEHELLEPGFIGVYDLDAKSFRTSARLTEPAGTLMPLGEDYAIGFYRHPKLIDLKTGAILRKWEELNSGYQTSSIIRGHKEKLPPLALDPANKRFAVASEREITVIQLG
jgi:hypothetical protein